MRRRVLRYVGLSVLGLAVFHLMYVSLGAMHVYLAAQVLVAVAATTFSVVYHATARWWATAMGRNIMLLVGTIAALVDLGLVFNLLGRPEWMREVFAGLFVVVGLAIGRRLIILIDAQYHSDDHVDKKPPTAPADQPWPPGTTWLDTDKDN